MAKAIVDALEVIDIKEHDRQLATLCGFLRKLLGKDLVEAATVDQVGQGVVMRHLLQRLPGLVQLAEQGIDPAQVALLVLQLAVRQRCADAAADHQQGDHGDGHAQLQRVVGLRERGRHALR